DRIDTMRSDLRVYRDENGRELFDHPDLAIEDPDRPAPERFLPEFDNVLLSYSNRTRIIAGEHRKAVFVPVLRVRPTFLVDGFVAGTWRFEKAKGKASVTIEPFGPLSTNSRQALLEEGERLVRFAGYDSKNYEVGFGS
ncbi:MAG TPA: crosslink repair DNA glycosylase YcaQ family protein, partial [Actinomycetota bacterium]|nr:crosslink repair DNA glycosylase YcaQ family protein [Actinomycetota bacterium]